MQLRPALTIGISERRFLARQVAAVLCIGMREQEDGDQESLRQETAREGKHGDGRPSLCHCAQATAVGIHHRMHLPILPLLHSTASPVAQLTRTPKTSPDSLSSHQKTVIIRQLDPCPASLMQTVFRRSQIRRTKNALLTTKSQTRIAVSVYVPLLQSRDSLLQVQNKGNSSF